MSEHSSRAPVSRVWRGQSLVLQSLLTALGVLGLQALSSRITRKHDWVTRTRRSAGDAGYRGDPWKVGLEDKEG